MVGDALLDIIFSPEENDGVGMLIGGSLVSLLSVCKQAFRLPCSELHTDKCSTAIHMHFTCYCIMTQASLHLDWIRSRSAACTTDKSALHTQLTSILVW